MTTKNVLHSVHLPAQSFKNAGICALLVFERQQHLFWAVGFSSISEVNGIHVLRCHPSEDSPKGKYTYVLWVINKYCVILTDPIYNQVMFCVNKCHSIICCSTSTNYYHNLKYFLTFQLSFL